MLIDTGANDNVIAPGVVNAIEGLLSPTEEKRYAYGIDGNCVNATLYQGTLSFFGKEYETKFQVREDEGIFKQLSLCFGFPIIAIIGTSFMTEHRWVIDFAQQEVIIPDDDTMKDV